MKKIIITAVMIGVLAFLYGCIQPVSEVESLELVGLDTLEFIQSDTMNVDISGVDVVVTFADDTTQTLGIDEVTVTGSAGAFVTGEDYLLEMSTAGDFTLTIAYGGVTVSITYTVRHEDWSNLTDTTWHNIVDTAFTIDTAAELAGLAEIVNSGTDTFAGDTITLGASIDLLHGQWTPIGTGEWALSNPPYGSGQTTTITQSFQGSFNGGGFTISNLYVNQSQGNYLGLFGVVTGTGTISNLTLDTVEIVGYGFTAAVAGYSVGTRTYDSITLDTVHVESGHYNAGIVGYAGGSAGSVFTNNVLTDIVLMTYVLDIESNGDKTGGIVGYGPNSTVQDNTITNIDATGYRDLGAVMGMVSGTDNSKVTGNTVTNATLHLDKTQLSNPNFRDGEKSDKIRAGIIIGRMGTAGYVVEATNTFTNASIFIRGYEASDFAEYAAVGIGFDDEADYTAA